MRDTEPMELSPTEIERRVGPIAFHQLNNLEDTAEHLGLSDIFEATQKIESGIIDDARVATGEHKDLAKQVIELTKEEQ